MLKDEMVELKRANVHRIVASKGEAEKLISDGFEVIKDTFNLLEKEIKGEVENASQEPVDYSAMTMDQLKVICKDNNLEGYTTLNKEDLIKFIQENVK